MKKIIKQVECRSPVKMHPCDTCRGFDYINKKFGGRGLSPDHERDLYDCDEIPMLYHVSKFRDGSVAVYLTWSILNHKRKYNDDLCTVTVVVDGPSEDDIIREIKEKYFTNMCPEVKLKEVRHPAY